MNSRTTWVLLFVALGLGAFIFLFERRLPSPAAESKPTRILPGLQVADITSVTVRPVQRLEIQAVKTNGQWQVLTPSPRRALGMSIKALLQTLSEMEWQARITAKELKDRPNYSREFGFEVPQFSLVIQKNSEQLQILIGSLTPLRDQLFLQVVGQNEIYLVSSQLLTLLPRIVTDWRNPQLIDLKGLAYDHLVISNGTKSFEMQRVKTGKSWQILRPIEARADQARIEHLLEQLQNIQFTKFVSDDPKADLDTYGLSTPDLSLNFMQGEDSVVTLQFSKPITNQPALVYALRSDVGCIGIIPKETLVAWEVSFDEFRDRHLVELSGVNVNELEATSVDHFVVQLQTNGAWRVTSPEDLPADTALVREAIGTLGSMEIAQFVKSVVTEPDFPSYGLSPAVSRFWLRDSTATNPAIAELDFGSTTNGQVYVRRADETAVYAVSRLDYLELPTAGWRLRDRQLWNFSENDVTKVSIRQNGKLRELIHNGTNQWAFAANSQGIINNFAVEEAVATLGQLSAAYWTARSETNLTTYGFTEDSLRVTLEVNHQGSTEEYSVQFGGIAPSQLTYGAVTLNDQVWIFETPARISEIVRAYLAIPSEP